MLILTSCVFVVDHDDSPNSPPSAVSSQGSSVDISLAREVSFVQSLCECKFYIMLCIVYLSTTLLTC